LFASLIKIVADCEITGKLYESPTPDDGYSAVIFEGGDELSGS